MAQKSFSPRISSGLKIIMMMLAIAADLTQIGLNLYFGLGAFVNFILISLPINTIFFFWFRVNGVNYIFPKKKNISESKGVQQAVKFLSRFNWKPIMELLPFIPFLDTLPWLSISVWQLANGSQKDDLLEYNKQQAQEKMAKAAWSIYF